MDNGDIRPPISIIKTLWTRSEKDRWRIRHLNSLDLRPKDGFSDDYFAFETELQMMASENVGNIEEFLSSVGPTDFLLKQSIVPVVAWYEGDSSIRVIGTASIISCTGYVVTAAHVLLDPFERGHRSRSPSETAKHPPDELNFGVIIPNSPLFGFRGFKFFPFEKYWIWGRWQSSPLLHQADHFEFLTDLAICKIPSMPKGAAHQPLNMSLNPFTAQEGAYAIGYAEMEDIPITYGPRGLRITDFQMELFVSIGRVMNIFPNNHAEKIVPTPGPCFDFEARIPGKMSGAPVFGAEGAVIRGVVSRSFSGERHAYGAMLGPAMGLPLDEPGVSGRTLQTLQKEGCDGITVVYGSGL